jgi:acetylornithine aminotransferase
VSCAAALAVIDVIERDGLLEQVERLGAGWSEQLRGVIGETILGVRGRGLWLGLQTADGVAPALEAVARNHGFLINATGPDAIRLAPPLILNEAQATSFVDALPTIIAAAVDPARLSA